MGSSFQIVGNAIDRRCVLIVVVSNPVNSCATEGMQVRGLAKTRIRAEDIAVTHRRRIPMTTRSAAFRVGGLADGLRFLVSRGVAPSFEALSAELACTKKPTQLISKIKR